MHLVDGGRLSIRRYLVMDLRLLAPTDAPIHSVRRQDIIQGLILSKMSSTFRRTSTLSDPVQEALDMLLDPVAQNNAQGRRPHGFISMLMTCSWPETRSLQTGR